MEYNYDAIIVITPDDYKRVEFNFSKISELIPARNIIFVGNDEVGKLVKQNNAISNISFINEEDIISFDSVNKVILDILKTDSIPRRVTGWYYQQFLKMQFSFMTDSPFYLVWDGDTVPLKAFKMFDDNNGKPVFDLKYECHEEYFITQEKLIGIGKCISNSFISEHMLFKTEYMRELIKCMEANDKIEGEKFYEKILYAIREGQLLSNSFSEFETYGSYVATRYPDAYSLRKWHSIRYGSMYFIPEKLTDEDFRWLSTDFDAISFEKNQDYDPGFNELFTNEEYRQKLTPRAILEAIQDCASEGLNEKWD